ncbi:MAG: glycosyltransferase family 4 protein [Chloroflexota bacterium]|nr:glycosyltransferase family 4 protein [Chloroflexota bacterium]
MRIVLAHSHANTLGGGERAILELDRALDERHDVRLLLGGFDARSTYAELASLPHTRLGRLQWPVAHIRADAIVTNSFGANLLALRNGRRVAYWVHSTRSRFLLPGARRLDLRLRRAIDWLAVRRAARLVANSHYTAARLRQLYHRDADVVVYPGVDLSQFSPGPDTSPRDGAYAITVGRLSPEKGLDRLFGVWRDMPDLPLHVVGSGPVEVLRQLRASAPAGVVFRGHLTSSDLAAAYRGARVAVFAAYAEEFGMAPLEAMASGVPVVAWREGGLQETIVDGETGYLVPDGVTLRQRLRLLLHDDARRRAFGVAARRRAQAFTWRRTAAGIEAVCALLAQMPAPGPGE